MDKDFDQLDWIRIGRKLPLDRIGIFVFKSINYGMLTLWRVALLPNHNIFLLLNKIIVELKDALI